MMKIDLTLVFAEAPLIKMLWKSTRTLTHRPAMKSTISWEGLQDHLFYDSVLMSTKNRCSAIILLYVDLPHALLSFIHIADQKNVSL